MYYIGLTVTDGGVRIGVSEAKAKQRAQERQIILAHGERKRAYIACTGG